MTGGGSARSASPVAFVDPSAPMAYDEHTARERGLGGTEQMVARLAQALAVSRPVVVAQGPRRRATTSAGVEWRPFDASTGLDGSPSAVVLVQHWKLLARLRAKHPHATLVLWLHCFLGRRAGRRLGDLVRRTGALVVCVSKAHARATAAQIGPAPCGHIYNALEDDLGPDPEIERDPRLLLSLSSRHKGQWQVLENFAAVRQRLPEARLLIADPGYFGGRTKAQPGVLLLGSLRRPEALRWLARAGCLFYPQSTFRETFGLVFAEANALGTPVLAHPLGAAPEVLDSRQLVDANTPAEVVERLASWWCFGAPRVRLKPIFRMRYALDQWRSLLEQGRLPERRADLDLLATVGGSSPESRSTRLGFDAEPTRPAP